MTASSVALWGFNGTMPQSGTELSKEFNPENPPLGSNVVATFVWTGSTNVIDSVTDALWTGRRVGNTYRLVEYVTAGGISMATYVATNVQNFPSPKQALGEELLITAHLSTPVSGGGTLVSAYTGGNPVFPQAVGAHRSATGSGSTTPTTAHPGAITVSAGQLVYAVSMTSEASAGRTPPAGFTYITNNQMSSPPLQIDAEYTVESSATSVDPAWGWSFTSPHTWLASAIALNPASGSTNQPPVAAFTSSCSTLTCGFTSTSSDADGSISAYSWSFGDGGTASAQNPSHNYSAAGTHTVMLTVTDDQGATSSVSHSVSPTALGMGLWGFNGTMPQSGTDLSKEFNPENPPLGSTVIATFVWLGSGPNIITAVTDEIETGQQVGNAYDLVEYVSTGGISMATYVACNVQNFPSPKRVLGEELLIRAHLSTPISGGGLIVSAYTGVNSVCAQALGAHRSATGSGSTTPTTAHPGSIVVEPGQFVYAVSMTSEGLAGRTAPAGFTYMTGVGNESPGMQFDVEYLVPTSAGSVDPAWGWSFNSQHTWLATVITLNPAGSGPSNQPPVAAFTSSCSALSCGLTSTSSDPDGSISTFHWDFGDGQTSAVQNPSHDYGAAGTYPVALTVTDDQGATNTTSQPLTVAAANQPPVAAFTSSCNALTCSFTSTSSDPDGSISAYSWTFGDGASSAAQNPSHSYATAGTRTVTLTVADDQGATSSTSQAVTVAAANQPPVAAFTSSCSALTCGFTSTSSDPDGSINAYSWTFGDGGTAALQNPSHNYAAAGTYTVTLTVTDNQGATNAISHSVTITSGSTRIALDQFNGTLNERDTSVLAKGFNPTNPRLGDAVIATIFWVGPATIVSVSDFMTNTERTPVGNTFHLVESVSSGGVSMATYVATNIQGFAEPNPDPNVVYAVQARLSQTPPDGGLLLSAYRGVHPTYANALAGSQSTTGVGTGITPADPGALTVGAGALVYAVSMSNGLFFSDKPLAPFTDIGGGMGDPFMVTDGVYAVAAGAGSLHPRWTYYFDNGQYAWLATVLALNPAP